MQLRLNVVAGIVKGFRISASGSNCCEHPCSRVLAGLGPIREIKVLDNNEQDTAISVQTCVSFLRSLNVPGSFLWHHILPDS